MSTGPVIAVATLKGGVGKTTVSVSMAAALARSAPEGYRVGLADCDSMGSATRWAYLAEHAGTPLPFDVRAMPAADLHWRLPRDFGGALGVIVDAPPPGPGADRIAAGVMSVASVVVMPVPPAQASLDRIPATAAQARESGATPLAVLTMTRAGLPDTAYARAALDRWGIPVAETEYPLRAEIQRNYGAYPWPLLTRLGADLMSEVIRVIQEGAK